MLPRRRRRSLSSSSDAGAAIDAAGSRRRGMICRLQTIWFGADRAFPLALATLALLAIVAHSPSGAAQGTTSAEGGWREFSGSMNLTGRRRIIEMGSERRAAIVQLSGTLLLSGPQRPGVGFGAEVLALNDSSSGLVGRALWTDEHGDQMWSELKGQGTATGNHIDGTITGGTGRYKGAEGTYELSWQYVIEAEDGTVQGRAVGLKGRVRAASRAAK